MLTSLLNLLILGMCGFIAMFFAYKPQLNRYEQTLEFDLKMLPFPYIFLLYCVGVVAAYFIGTSADFVEPLALTRTVVPLVLAAAIYASFELFGEFMFYVTVLISVSLTVWLQPLGEGAPFAPLSSFWVRVLAFVFGVIFCFGNRILNFLPHTFVLPNVVILFGLCVLFFVGASPLFIALCAAILLGILCAYLCLNYYVIKIELNDGACTAIAYLICNLLLLNLGEFCFPSCLIFTAVLLAEIVMAVWRKFVEANGGMLRENTDFYLAAQIYTLQGLTAGIIRVCSVLLFIGWFQLFSVNQYSLPIVAFCLAIWLNNSLVKRSPETFKEINQEVINNIKQNIAETKSLFNKKDEDLK